MKQLHLNPKLVCACYSSFLPRCQKNVFFLGVLAGEGDDRFFKILTVHLGLIIPFEYRCYCNLFGLPFDLGSVGVIVK